MYCVKPRIDGLDWHRWMASEFPVGVSVLRTGARWCASALRRGSAVGFGAWQRKKIMDLTGWGIDAAGTLAQLGAAAGTGGYQAPPVTGRGSVPCLAVRNRQPAMLAEKVTAPAD